MAKPSLIKGWPNSAAREARTWLYLDTQVVTHLETRVRHLPRAFSVIVGARNHLPANRSIEFAFEVQT